MRELKPLRLWTYRYWNPSYQQWVTVDCPSTTIEGAFASALRWIEATNALIGRSGLYAKRPYSLEEMRGRRARRQSCRLVKGHSP